MNRAAPLFYQGTGGRAGGADRQRRPPPGQRHARPPGRTGGALRPRRAGIHRHRDGHPARPGGIFRQRGRAQQSGAGPGRNAVRGVPQAGQAGGDHPPQRGTGREPHRALFQPLLRGRTQKRGCKERAVQPHRRRSRQTGGARRAAPRRTAAGPVFRRVRRAGRIRQSPVFLRGRRRTAARCAGPRQRPHPGADHRQRGRFFPRGGRSRRRGGRRHRGPGAAHPALRDRPPWPR